MKDVTLNDGTFLPKGTVVLAATYPIHLDEDNYASAAEFDPFRFSRMREASEGESTKHQFVNTSIEYILFGHGKHAWYVRNTHMIARLHWGVRRVLMSDSTALADSSLRTSLRPCSPSSF